MEKDSLPSFKKIGKDFVLAMGLLALRTGLKIASRFVKNPVVGERLKHTIVVIDGGIENVMDRYLQWDPRREE